MVELYHPAGPLASYEVATIKPADPNAAPAIMGGVRVAVGTRGQTIQSYILNAYGASPVSRVQIVGSPAWLATDAYVINGKVPDDLRAALDKMTPEDRLNQTRQMQQSLLVDRFNLKVHFETRNRSLVRGRLALSRNSNGLSSVSQEVDNALLG